MACCVLTAYFMSRLIKACEFLDLDIIKIQYNRFDDGPDNGFTNDDDRKERLVTSKIAIEGMTCAACVSVIQGAVNTLEGVERVSVSLPLACATVVHWQSVNDETILDAIEAGGYAARPGERTAQQNLDLLARTEEIQEMRKAFTEAAFFSSSISGLESLSRLRLLSKWIATIQVITVGIAIWIQVFDAKLIHINAWRAFSISTLTMDTLVSLSMALGIALSLFNVLIFGFEEAHVYWSSVSFLTTVVVGGRLLDLILRKQNSATFAQLYQLQEKTMNVKIRRRNRNSELIERIVDAAALQVGDEIEIGTASLMPCDCYVLDGNTSVDQSTMTGESIPVFKRPGDFLMSGTRNISSPITGIVYKVKEESALAALISSVSASTETSTLDTSTDLTISRFVSGILGIALLAFVLTLFSRSSAGFKLTLSFNAASERAMAVLASACPCALGLAAPSAVMAGLDACRLRGILVKQGLDTFRSMASLTHLVLDKTGTLTTGQLSVARVEGDLCEASRILICLAERDLVQSHPVARTLFQWSFASLSEEARRKVADAEAVIRHNPAGNGIEASHSGTTIHLGSEQFMSQNDIQCARSLMANCEVRDAILIHAAVDRSHIGSIRLQDTVRPEANAVIEYLCRSLNISLSMLTGDTEIEAQRVSKMLGIKKVASHSLPTEKKSFLERIQRQSSANSVAMLGDGINDGPALAQADVGVCLSTNLSPVPSLSETANFQISDVIFTSPNLCRLPEVLEIARKTVDQSDWNLRWAVVYNCIAVALAMGVAEPFGVRVNAARAGTMMALSSISVLLWGLWLRYDLSRVSFRPP